LDALSSGHLADPLTPGLHLVVLSSGKKVWKYARRISRSGQLVRLSGGQFPAWSIAAARDWARKLNEEVEVGIDPRQTAREAEARASMTVAKAHGLYMRAVREGRSSRAKRPNKPRTISDKLEIYERDIAPKLASRIIYEVGENDLIKLVDAKGKVAKVRANRLAAELKVFFGWAASLRGLEVGLETDPSTRLGDLRFPETARSRKLSLLELEWFLRALVDEPRHFQRGMLLWLLTAARISEVARARSEELVNGVWTIPGGRAKNSVPHSIALGPWGRALMQSDHEWIFPAERVDGPRNNSVWYKARDRVRARMAEIAGHPIERFTPHDFRRTARSNTKRLQVDYETAEAMLNHVKKGLERTYDLYEMDEEKRAWFLKWEHEVAAIAKRAGAADALGVPEPQRCGNQQGYSITISLPQGARFQPALDLGAPEPRTAAVFAQAAPKLVFAGKTGRPTFPPAVDLPSRNPCQAGKFLNRDKVRKPRSARMARPIG
jgi:integrase